MSPASDLQSLIAASSSAQRERRPADAAQSLQEAVRLAPTRLDLRTALVRNLIESGQLESAARAAEELVNASPKNADSLNLLGVVQKRQGKLQQALETFRQATKVNKRLFSPYINIGNTARMLQRHDEAIGSFRQATKLNPKDAEAVRLLGGTLCDAGRDEEGLAQLGRAIMMDAKNPDFFNNRAAVLYKLGRFDDALKDAERAIVLAPQDPTGHRGRASILRRLGRLAESRAAYEQILATSPDDVATLESYANLCGRSMGDYPAANAALRRARLLRPADIRIAGRLCDALMDSRYEEEGKFIDEAHSIAAPIVDSQQVPFEVVDNLRAVFQRTADFPRLSKLGDRQALMRYWAENDNVGALHNQLSRVETMEDRKFLLECHRHWGNRLSKSVPARERLNVKATPLTGRKLKVGLMSSDLRNHPVAYFALPIFEHYNPDRVELYCYSFYPGQTDKAQAYMAERSTAYRLMPSTTVRETAEQIRADGIDVLFELGGTTRYNRIEVMIRRPAPVQVSWLGYPHSAGLAEIDHILTDPYLEPPDPSLLMETPFRMPESWVCLGRLGFSDQAIEAGTPEERTGQLTFGTMNNPYKFTAATIELWAKVLARVPNSRFLLVRPEGGAKAFRDNIGDIFEKHGVSRERVAFMAVRGVHMQHYNSIDIALDAVPHTGGTTTCEALWMGVPTVTLIGPAFFERLSYSNLTNAGLGDLCAKTREEYVDIAVKLAAGQARRQGLRRELRDQLRASPLGQTQRWVTAFLAKAMEAVENKAAGS
jgi:predicted O-linked N-acetylglucosamine transferase (SPINDLY family)